jgi:hypothetical protein
MPLTTNHDESVPAVTGMKDNGQWILKPHKLYLPLNCRQILGGIV